MLRRSGQGLQRFRPEGDGDPVRRFQEDHEEGRGDPRREIKR